MLRLMIGDDHHVDRAGGRSTRARMVAVGARISAWVQLVKRDEWK